MHASQTVAGAGVGQPNSRNERRTEEEHRPEPTSSPETFHNDPNDPENPNEARERHLKKINQ